MMKDFFNKYIRNIAADITYAKWRDHAGHAEENKTLKGAAKVVAVVLLNLTKTLTSMGPLKPPLVSAYYYVTKLSSSY